MKKIISLSLILLSTTAHAILPYQVYQYPASGNIAKFGAVNLSQSAAVTGTLPNARTTADSTNTSSTIVLRDGSGNFSCGTITGALNGNSTTATSLASNPTDCGSNTFATTIDSSGNLTCSAVSLTADVSGILPVANGGTGTNTLTLNNVILGNGTSAVQLVAPGTSGNVLTSNGTTWLSSPSAGGSGTASVKFTLEGATVPFTSINGTHYQTTTQSLTTVNISALNSGTSGSTVVQVNQYRSGSLLNSATASLAASSGNPSGSAASLSGTLSLLAGDIITVDVNSVAGGSPSELSVEY